MKVVIVVETPEDDELHWPRIERALAAYWARVRRNHTGVRVDAIGCDGGPNRLVVHDQAGDITVTEVRIDRDRLLWRIWSALPWWLRWTVSWALPV